MKFDWRSVLEWVILMAVILWLVFGVAVWVKVLFFL